jgi:hypothetical protein
MSAHTPGPWWATSSGVRDAGGMICLAIRANRYSEQEERYEVEVLERAANDRLIAAAPDLLEALNQYALPFTDQKEARAEFGDLEVDRELVRRAVIAKATGAAA